MNSIGKVIFYLILTILNTLCILYRITILYNFWDFLSNILLYSMILTSIYYLYALVKEIKIMSCQDTNSAEKSFMRDTFFKFCFSLQGYSAFIHVHSKCQQEFQFNDTALGEVIAYYSTFFLFVIMILSIHFTKHKVIEEQYNRDIFILLGFIVIMYLVSSILMSFSFGVSYFVINFGNYLYIILLTTSFYQFYYWLVTNKLGPIYDPDLYSAL